MTFENVQAGLRTDYLFRLANHHGGLVVGTGDLSELALGWCTYGVGDQMSHYNVNASVSEDADPAPDPLRRRVAATSSEETARDPATPSWPPRSRPSWCRPAPTGAIQSTESDRRPLRAAGLQPLLRDAATASARRRSPFWRWHAWADAGARRLAAPTSPETARRAYDLAEIKRWLRVFLTRFFELSQFKRSALPNGPKISSGGSLSPRGDWRAPSDASATVWLAELERGVPDEE